MLAWLSNVWTPTQLARGLVFESGSIARATFQALAIQFGPAMVVGRLAFAKHMFIDFHGLFFPPSDCDRSISCWLREIHSHGHWRIDAIGLSVDLFE